MAGVAVVRGARDSPNGARRHAVNTSKQHRETVQAGTRDTLGHSKRGMIYFILK